jgi:HK97 family phage prohead protease
MDLEQQLAQKGAEARSVAFTDLDVGRDGRSFDGYAAVYGSDTDLGEYTEVIMPPAFRSVLSRMTNVPMLWDHNDSMPPLATTAGGTMTLEEDRRGLRVKATIDERHILGPTLISMLERGDVRGMSFGFVAGQGNSKLAHRSGGKPQRVLRGFNQLLDVSPTWNPAYAGTSAELRSLRQMASIIDVPQQLLTGEVPQPEDGVADEDLVEVVPGEPVDEVVDGESDEQERSGVDSALAEAAARKRRLQMLGMTLPK